MPIFIAHIMMEMEEAMEGMDEISPSQGRTELAVATIRVETFIDAPMEVCFDLARDIRVHEQTTGHTNERVVSLLRNGVESDSSLLELGDVVTFEAKHLGVRQRLTSRIVSFDPFEFCDEMQKGAFKELKHVHRFESKDGGTLMTDILEFRSPFGVLGRLVDVVFLAAYMRRFITRRGLELKRLAEERR
jgi:ligand-binding SRPBCC domain-containing protein